MDYEAAISALIVLTTNIVGAVLKDDELTDEEKKAFIDRITKAQELVPEWP